jgi:hypothetical protein
LVVSYQKSKNPLTLGRAQIQVFDDDEFKLCGLSGSKVEKTDREKTGIHHVDEK